MALYSLSSFNCNPLIHGSSRLRFRLQISLSRSSHIIFDPQEELSRSYLSQLPKERILFERFSRRNFCKDFRLNNFNYRLAQHLKANIDLKKRLTVKKSIFSPWNKYSFMWNSSERNIWFDWYHYCISNKDNKIKEKVKDINRNWWVMLWWHEG